MVAMFFAMLYVSALTTLSSPNWKVACTVFVVSMTFICGLIFLQTRWMFKQFRATKLYLGDTGMVKESGSIRQEVSWAQITKLKIRKNSQGEIRNLEIHRTADRPVGLFGFNEMSEIARIIQMHVPEKVRITTKQGVVDWENPFVLFAMVALMGVLFETIRRTGGMIFYSHLNAVIQSMVGVWFLVYAPVSRKIPKFRKWEIILGALILILNLIALLCAFWRSAPILR